MREKFAQVWEALRAGLTPEAAMAGVELSPSEQRAILSGIEADQQSRKGEGRSLYTVGSCW
ncbi:MAG: hypothetical protein IMW91_01445 [Firmicutes bacterium]|nr:hypothetical protein [Bacillota bacterium]